MNIISEVIRENDLTDWLISLGTGLTCFLCLRVGVRLLHHKLPRLAAGPATHRIDILARAISVTNPITLILVSIYAATRILTLIPAWESFLVRGLIVVVAVQAGIWGNNAILGWMEQRGLDIAAHGNKAALSSLSVFKVMAQFALWVTILLLLLDNLGFNIRALVTSLGIGGVAVALALQNILGDLFASLSIAMDKPFEVGDFISVDDIRGTVQRIGLKTTRAQSVSGEELIFSNSDLLRSRVRNFKRMSQRRVSFTFSITDNVSSERIKQVTDIVKHVVETQEKTKFHRIQIKKFGSANIDFEVVYSLVEQDYDHYLATQQAISLAMLTELSAAKIAFTVSM